MIIDKAHITMNLIKRKGIKMRDNKLNKQRRHRKNEELKKNGRTSRQVSLKKMKEAISNYLIQYPKYKFPPTFNIDLKYFHYPLI